MSDPGTTAGSAGYMAIEQLQGAGRVRPQADVFSLGVMLFEALTGRLPYEAPSLVSYARALQETRPPLLRTLRPEAPAWLETVVERALSRDEAGRPASGSELARLLVHGKDVPAGRSRVGFAVAGALLVVVLSGALLLAGSRATPGAPPAAPALPHVAPPPGPSALQPGAEEERLGDADVAADRNEDALAHYDRAIALAPGVARLYRKKTSVLNKLPLPATEAVEVANKAISLDDRSADAFVLRAFARARANDTDGAFEDAAHAVELDPKNAAALHTYANGLRDRGHLKEALEMLDRSLEIEPGSAIRLFDRSCVHVKRGDLARARADLDASIESHPFFFAYRNRAKIRAQTGDLPGAIEDAEAAVSLAPENVGCQELLAQLRAKK